MAKPDFSCPQCDFTRIEEIMTGVVQASIVDDLEENGVIYYGNHSCDKGEVSHFQCIRCGWAIPDATDGAELLIALENLKEEKRGLYRSKEDPAN